MKMFFVASAVCGLVAGVHAQQPAAMPTPIIMARTNAAAKRIVRTDNGETKTAQDSRTMSVKVNVSFLSAPPAPYEVQCFFIAKNGNNQSRSIFDALKETSQGKTTDLEFTSEPIVGGRKQWTAMKYSSSVTGNTGAGYGVVGATTQTTVNASKTKGNVIEGWIVRVVAQGRVLRMESNQPALRQAASDMAASLNEAAAKIEKKPN